MAQDGKVLGGMTDADPALVFAEADIQRPMQRVLDGPMPTHRASEGLGISGNAREEEAPLDRHLALDFANRFDHADRAQFLPLGVVRKPRDVLRDPIAARFRAAMTALTGSRKSWEMFGKALACASSMKLFTSSCKV